VRAVHVVRKIAASIAWCAGIAFVVGLAPPLLFGIGNGTEDGCGTIIDKSWRWHDGTSSCRDRALSWMTWELLILAVAVGAGALWWFAFRRDTHREPWQL
jgi:hypothetical protein